MGAPGAMLLSGRAQKSLQQLQRNLAVELRTLNAQESLFYGALQACDFGTQITHLQEYLNQVDAVLAAVARLRAFVERHHDSAFAAGPDARFIGQME
jgi:hypothetical protein